MIALAITMGKISVATPNFNLEHGHPYFPSDNPFLAEHFRANKDSLRHTIWALAAPVLAAQIFGHAAFIHQRRWGSGRDVNSSKHCLWGDLLAFSWFVLCKLILFLFLLDSK